MPTCHMHAKIPTCRHNLHVYLQYANLNAQHDMNYLQHNNMHAMSVQVYLLYIQTFSQSS